MSHKGHSSNGDIFHDPKQIRGRWKGGNTENAVASSLQNAIIISRATTNVIVAAITIATYKFRVTERHNGILTVDKSSGSGI